MSVIDWVRARRAEARAFVARRELAKHLAWLEAKRRDDQRRNPLTGELLSDEFRQDRERANRAAEARVKAQEAAILKPTPIEQLFERRERQASAQTITVTISVPPGSNVSVTKT